METVVVATIPIDQFVLEEAIERVPDVEFEFLQSAIHSSKSTIPFLWTSTSQPDELDAALQRDPSIDRVRRLSMDDDRGLYEVDWTASAARLIDEFAETGSVLDVRGTPDHWEFQILFPDRATASETFQAWRDDGIDPSLSRIGNFSCPEDKKGGLSATQHSTITQAFEADYYKVPRGTTLEELSSGFDVSHQAVSERLRRGHSHLVEQLLSESTTGAETRL
ncbi:helix-turn-helix domain-containing protein [Halorubrum halophilum]|uniref:helix-turn-helix domain-containing protein n=1 Tax=Halorubrum halophilum TaxID=413816 RepID=UPI0006786A92|nr:bacterio-opsin activator domain-containing protein [Halorubrum halophilum]